ncbi:uncharacterized protein LOC110913647 [Helianthus annuus]|uniref:uncharacterized protein LOC110913647 n=1 Tax=Helianthus annuus TaxID=4232 RepID=UPI000B8F5532|nr:uncharacterized protein LOC110913647 [Helianthus annuus]
MESLEELAYYYYESQQYSLVKEEEEPISTEKISKDILEKDKNALEVDSEKVERDLEVDSEKMEKDSEEVSEKSPVFDKSSDEESDDDSEEIEKLEYYKRMFAPELYNMFYAGKLEELKNKQAAKMKNHKSANVEEINDEIKPEERVRVVMKQVEEIPAFKNENEADDKKILGMCSNCEKSKSENVKLLRDVDILTLKIKYLKEKEKDFEIQK